MKICTNCGHRDNPLWRYSRYDFNADYMRWEDGQNQIELTDICRKLGNQPIGTIYVVGPYTYYRRGKRGLWLYRVANENYKVSVEKRAKPIDGKQVKLLPDAFPERGSAEK